MSGKKVQKLAKTKAAKKPVVKRRIGTIVLATAVLENAESRAYLCRSLFREFCPVFISVSPEGKRRAFTGFCERFEEVAEGEPVPRYVFKVHQDETGKQELTFAKLEG